MSGGPKRLDTAATTLVEATLALTLLLLLLSELGETERSVRLGLERHGRLAVPEAQMLAAVTRFSADCAHVVDPAFRSGPDDPAFELLNGGGSEARGRLTMYVAEQGGRAAEQDLRRVTYELNGGWLVRVSGPPRSYGAHAPEREEQLVADVVSLRCRLYDGKSWVEDWKGVAGEPKGASLELGRSGGFKRTWRVLFGGAGTR